MASNLWTPEDIRFLRENYGKISHLEIADALGRSTGAIEKKVAAYGLATTQNFNDARRMVRDLWGTIPPKDIARQVGIAQSTVFGFAKQMNLGPSGFAPKGNGHSLGTIRANELRELAPPKPKGMTSEQIEWAKANPRHPEGWMILVFAWEGKRQRAEELKRSA